MSSVEPSDWNTASSVPFQVALHFVHLSWLRLLLPHPTYITFGSSKSLLATNYRSHSSRRRGIARANQVSRHACSCVSGGVFSRYETQCQTCLARSPYTLEDSALPTDNLALPLVIVLFLSGPTARRTLRLLPGMWLGEQTIVCGKWSCSRASQAADPVQILGERMDHNRVSETPRKCE